MAININSEVSSYFLERLQTKREIHNEIYEEYPNDIGTTFSNYGSQIKKLYGNDILGYTAADALYSGEESWIYNNNSLQAPNRVGYLTYLNRPSETQHVDAEFPGVTVLSVKSAEKFHFWFRKNNYISSLTFPDLSVLVFEKDFKYSGPLHIDGTRYDFNKANIPLGYINAPNLKYVSENILPRNNVYWANGMGQEVDENYSGNKMGPYSVSANISTNQVLEKIPDDFVLNID